MKVVNPKKPLRLKNTTKYFVPGKDKVRNSFSSPESYLARKSKIEGYESRLYWQYRYCQDVGGQTFFYTLTYADKNLPEMYGQPCFDYEDLRDLFTGGFRKMLLRKYGTTFKYFVGAELGDGKGSRGFGNNPHYHVLFFLEPAPYSFTRRVKTVVQDGFYKRSSHLHSKGDPRYKTIYSTEKVEVPYRLIAPEQFRRLVRMYWQGFDEDERKGEVLDYRTETKYGICKEGDNIGLVTDFRACMYCAKYVCKDVRLKMRERNIRSLLGFRFRDALRNDVDFHKDFFHQVVYPLYNIPLDTKDHWKYDDKALMVQLLPDLAKIFAKISDPKDYFPEQTFVSDVKRVCYKNKLWSQYNKFLNERVSMEIDASITEWRNRYCNKCRISQGVGEYALEHISDPLHPTITVPDKNGFKERPICLYYYRKLFTSKVCPFEINHFGKVVKYPNIRVLNQTGLLYKLNNLAERVVKLQTKSLNNLKIVLHNEELYDLMRNSDVNTSVSWSFDEFKFRIDEYMKEHDILHLECLCRFYAIYKLVYEDRYFPIPDNLSQFPKIDLSNDYLRFIEPSILSVSRSDLRLDCFVESNFDGYLSYAEHPEFLPYTGFFAVLDLCADYFFIQTDNKNQSEAEKAADLRRFHKKRELSTIEKFK